MKASVSAQCAIRAVIDIAINGGNGQLVRCSSIAANARISRRFLSNILGKLTAYGILTSRPGPSGGYALARATSEISILDVIEAVDGPLDFQPARHPSAANSAKRCAPRLAMQKAEGGLPVVATIMNRSRGRRTHTKHEMRPSAIAQLAKAMREMLGQTTLDLFLEDKASQANRPLKRLPVNNGNPEADSVALVG
jgi:Rrf2 family protein